MEETAVGQVATLIDYLPAAEAEQLVGRLAPDTARAVKAMPQASGKRRATSGVRQTVERFVTEFACYRHRSGSVEDGLRYLGQIAPSRLSECLRHEQSQTVAATLTLLPPAAAARILVRLSPGQRTTVLQQIAVSQRMSPQVIEALVAGLVEAVTIARSGQPQDQLAAILEHLEAA